MKIMLVTAIVCIGVGKLLGMQSQYNGRMLRGTASIRFHNCKANFFSFDPHFVHKNKTVER